MKERQGFFNTIYTYAAWIILGSLLVAYLAFRVLNPELTIEETLKDFYAWLHLVFVVISNVIMVAIAYDTATQKGTESDEFEKGDQLNNSLIKEYNKNPGAFREFVFNLNEHERETLREEFLFSKGVKNYEELDEKSKKEWTKLRPIYHNIIGFNLPLYYESDKNGEVNYKASERKNKGKYKQMIIKGAGGVVFGLMTVNVIINLKDVGGAFISLAIIIANLLVTFLMIFGPRFHKFSNELPKKVLHKNALWQSFQEKADELKKKYSKIEEVKTSPETSETKEVRETPTESVETTTTT